MDRILRQAVLSALMAGTIVSANAETAKHDGALKARVEAARTTTGEFVGRLGKTMKQEMQAGGPAAAMKVCRDEAPRIANEMSLAKGWKVTRVGTRVRNPMLGLPDAWEQKVLRSFAERAAAGESIKAMAHYEVVEEPDGKSLRFMKAIGVAPQCLACHGSSDQIAEPVRTQLETLYPHDRAVNYRVGDLRGAVSIKQPLQD